MSLAVSSKLTLSQRKNLKKKAARDRHRAADAATAAVPTDASSSVTSLNGAHSSSTTAAATAASAARDVADDELGNVEVEYVADSLPPEVITGGNEELADIFKRFAARAARTSDDAAETTATTTTATTASSSTASAAAAAAAAAEAAHEPAKLTSRERKMQRIGRVGKLKQLVERPDVVEVWDATAPDPEFLVHLKAYRNSVPVPRHWNRKKRYLQGKRGVDKKPYELPDFIQATGIAKLRDAYVEREATKSMKSKGRERIAPKMGKMDINYQVLHDAFFKHQKRPSYLTAFGDLYYEGRENETMLSETRPGLLSNELRAALGIAPEHPPPWLANMQRNGPPPSYPNLRIPGVNAPIPHGAQYGFHPGGWGKPPIDEFGRPLYGDVFGTAPPVDDGAAAFDRTHWGAIVDESSESESESDDSDAAADDDSDAAAADDHDMDTDAAATAATADTNGFASVAPGAGNQTPSVVNLRKRGIETPSGLDTPADGFTVLQPQRAAVGSGIMQTAQTYALGGGGGAGGGAASGLASVAPEGTATSEPAFSLTKRAVGDKATGAAKDKASSKKIKSTF